jgi:Rrf2 family protein
VRITAKVDYAVRAAAELAARYSTLDDPGYVKADEVAESQAAPEAFVLGILNQLKLAGLVESKRGADGGYRLAFPPDRITVADIIRAIDGPLANVAGAYVEDVSYPGAAERVRDVWVALRAAMRTVLDETSLADVAAGSLPDGIRALIADDAAWKTRPNRLQTRRGGGEPPLDASPRTTS